MHKLAFLLAIEDFVSSPDEIGLPDVTISAGLSSILNIVFTLAGLLAVVFVIIGGVKYTLSGGDPSGLKSAKETITYAIIGLIVTLVAFGIVNFVTKIGA